MASWQKGLATGRRGARRPRTHSVVQTPQALSGFPCRVPGALEGLVAEGAGAQGGAGPGGRARAVVQTPQTPTLLMQGFSVFRV